MPRCGPDLEDTGLGRRNLSLIFGRRRCGAAHYFPRAAANDYADEVAMARRYGGVHYRFSIDTGRGAGLKIRDLAVQRFYYAISTSSLSERILAYANCSQRKIDHASRAEGKSCTGTRERLDDEGSRTSASLMVCDKILLLARPRCGDDPLRDFLGRPLRAEPRGVRRCRHVLLARCWSETSWSPRPPGIRIARRLFAPQPAVDPLSARPTSAATDWPTG